MKHLQINKQVLTVIKARMKKRLIRKIVNRTDNLMKSSRPSFQLKIEG
jgi:hypothetical protein